MENQHRFIKGYRDLTTQEICLMNDIKELGWKFEVLINQLEQHVSKQFDGARAAGNAEELTRLIGADPHRWLTEGKHSLQVGLMELTRSVAQPQFF